MRFWGMLVVLGLGICGAAGQQTVEPLARRVWFETRTEHFTVCSCGVPRDVYRVAARLEQFSEAYTLLAGARAVASPPILVMAFPDRESMKPFLPLYQGQPGNIAGFFKRGSDENLIVLALPGPDSPFEGMQVIFHEYAHLLFRHNDAIWPLWLKEGMAEIYSTFGTSGYTAFIAEPIAAHLRLLSEQPLMPLSQLFAVTPGSPQYNEADRQGMFYAESWLLTDFLMAGDVPAYKAAFGQFTRLLREGQLPDQAFTNALRTPLPVMENQLRRYLQRGEFAAIRLSLPANVSSVKAMSARRMTPVETWFRLGDELLRVNRPDEAESCFDRARMLAPASPLPWEGLGLVAARLERHGEAERNLGESLQRGSESYLAHYLYAREKYRLTADSGNRYAPLKGPIAAEIRRELLKSIALMPNFGQAHQLLGFFEMVQGEDLASAETQLRLAIQLDPEDQRISCRWPRCSGK